MTLSSWSLVATAFLSFAAAPIARRAEPTDGEVRAMRLVSAPGRAELVVQIKGAVSVKDMTLADPARIVIDVEGAVLPDALPRATTASIAPASLGCGSARLTRAPSEWSSSWTR